MNRMSDSIMDMPVPAIQSATPSPDQVNSQEVVEAKVLPSVEVDEKVVKMFEGMAVTKVDDNDEALKQVWRVAVDELVAKAKLPLSTTAQPTPSQSLASQLLLLVTKTAHVYFNDNSQSQPLEIDDYLEAVHILQYALHGHENCLESMKLAGNYAYKQTGGLAENTSALKERLEAVGKECVLFGGPTTFVANVFEAAAIIKTGVTVRDFAGVPIINAVMAKLSPEGKLISYSPLTSPTSDDMSGSRESSPPSDQLSMITYPTSTNGPSRQGSPYSDSRVLEFFEQLVEAKYYNVKTRESSEVMLYYLQAMEIEKAGWAFALQEIDQLQTDYLMIFRVAGPKIAKILRSNHTMYRVMATNESGYVKDLPIAEEVIWFFNFVDNDHSVEFDGILEEAGGCMQWKRGM